MFEYTKTVQDAINNDQSAFELLYNNSYGVVKREALKYMKNDFDADDVIQNTYLSIFKNLKNLDNPEKFIPWSVTICRNTCLNEVKRKNRISEETEFRPLVSEDDKEGLDTIPASSYDLTLNPSAAVDASETKRLLDEMIGELPVMQRACIIMWQENYSSKEIADELEIPDGTVKSNISYAKKKIREKVLKLEKDGTKLYGLSPVGFFLWILGRYDQIFQPASIIGKASDGYLAISEALDIGSGATAASGTVAVASESVAAESAGGTAAHTAATAGTKVVAKGLLSKVIGGSVASKVIASIVTISLIAGVSTGVNAIIKERKAESLQETVQEENQNPDANTEDTTIMASKKIQTIDKDVLAGLYDIYSKVLDRGEELLRDSGDSEEGWIGYEVADINNDPIPEIIIHKFSSNGTRTVVVTYDPEKEKIATASFSNDGEYSYIGPPKEDNGGLIEIVVESTYYGKNITKYKGYVNRYTFKNFKISCEELKRFNVNEYDDIPNPTGGPLYLANWADFLAPLDDKTTLKDRLDFYIAASDTKDLYNYILDNIDSYIYEEKCWGDYIEINNNYSNYRYTLTDINNDGIMEMLVGGVQSESPNYMKVGMFSPKSKGTHKFAELPSLIGVGIYNDDDYSVLQLDEKSEGLVLLNLCKYDENDVDAIVVRYTLDNENFKEEELMVELGADINKLSLDKYITSDIKQAALQPFSWKTIEDRSLINNMY